LAARLRAIAVLRLSALFSRIFSPLNLVPLLQIALERLPHVRDFFSSPNLPQSLQIALEPPSFAKVFFLRRICLNRFK
jgi:hypothetical protein